MKSEVKKHVLKMLSDLMKMQDGNKFKPKEVHVEMMAAKPMDEEEMPEEMSEEMPEDDCDPDMELGEDEDEFNGEDAKKMSLKDFLASRSKK